MRSRRVLILTFCGRAQILTREIQNDQPMYFVHYQKWDKKFDEWLEGDRIVAKDEQGLKQQQLLKAKGDAPSKGKAASKRKGGDDESEESDDGRRKKRKAAAGGVDDDDSLASVRCSGFVAPSSRA